MSREREAQADHEAAARTWEQARENCGLEANGRTQPCSLHVIQAIAAALAEAVRVARQEEREACAGVAENGRFLSEDSLEARWGKSCAAAIRRRTDAEATPAPASDWDRIDAVTGTPAPPKTGEERKR